MSVFIVVRHTLSQDYLIFISAINYQADEGEIIYDGKNFILSDLPLVLMAVLFICISSLQSHFTKSNLAFCML
jgi:hypothetical protein